VDENNNTLPIGHKGEIIITDLFNKAMPFIRYKTGDVGSLKQKKGVLFLDRLIGRTNDNIILPNGKISPGLTFYYVSKSLLEKSGIIKEFIVRQVKIDTFIFDVVMTREFHSSEIEFLKKSMSDYLQSNLIIIINKVSKIKRPKSGKIKHFYSEINER
jgi:phenylacetate-CoA ligase